MLLRPEWLPKVAMKAIVAHWTGGTHTVSALDKEHYHFIVGGKGEIVKGDKSIADNVNTADGKYAAHTRGFNTGVMGVSVACMGGNDVKESPFNAGKWPMTKDQWLS